MSHGSNSFHRLPFKCSRLTSVLCILQGPTQKRSRAAANKATQGGVAETSTHAAAVSIDKRAPALSVSCLCHLLNAVVDDGLVADSEVQVRLPTWDYIAA